MMGEIAGMSAWQIAALGVAFLGLGAGIGLAAWGMSTLVAAFKGLTGGEMVGAIIAIALVFAGLVATLYFGIPALAGLGTAAGYAALPLLAVGAAILMIGFGISLVLDSFADLAKAFEGIAKIKEGVAESLTILFATAGSLDGGDSEPIRAIGTTAAKLAALPSPATTRAAATAGAGLHVEELLSSVGDLVSVIKNASPPPAQKGKTAVINLDGKKVGDAIIPYINEALLTRMGISPGSYPKYKTGH